jgi:hypothetical protein
VRGPEGHGGPGRPAPGGNVVRTEKLEKAPAKDVLDALSKEFGDKLKVVYDDDLTLLILRGPADAVEKALGKLHHTGPDGKPIPAIELVKLHKVDADKVAKLIGKLIPEAGDKLTVTVRAAAKAVIIEGDPGLVGQAVALARQLDGPHGPADHPEHDRILFLHDVLRRELPHGPGGNDGPGRGGPCPAPAPQGGPRDHLRPVPPPDGRRMEIPLPPPPPGPRGPGGDRMNVERRGDVMILRSVPLGDGRFPPPPPGAEGPGRGERRVQVQIFRRDGDAPPPPPPPPGNGPQPRRMPLDRLPPEIRDRLQQFGGLDLGGDVEVEIEEENDAPAGE